MEKIEKLERRYAYLRIAMIVLMIAYIHKAGQTIWEYIWHPEIYTDPTMPWYMTMLISGAVIAVVSLIYLSKNSRILPSTTIYLWLITLTASKELSILLLSCIMKE